MHKNEGGQHLKTLCVWYLSIFSPNSATEYIFMASRPVFQICSINLISMVIFFWINQIIENHLLNRVFGYFFRSSFCFPGSCWMCNPFTSFTRLYSYLWVHVRSFPRGYLYHQCRIYGHCLWYIFVSSDQKFRILKVHRLILNIKRAI